MITLKLFGLIIFLTIITIPFTNNIDERTGEIIAIAIIFISIIIIIWSELNKNKKQKNLKLSNINFILDFIHNIKKIKNETPFISHNQKVFLAVDEEKSEILYGIISNEKIDSTTISIQDIISVMVIENGQGLISTNHIENSLGTAVVGGLLFGGAGAITGAIMGGSKNLFCHELGLQIMLNDIKNPILTINFTAGDKITTHSEYYKQLKIEVEKWYSIIFILLKRASS